MHLFREGEEMERGPPTCVNPFASTAPAEPSQKHVPGEGFALGKSGLALQEEKWVVLKIKQDALVLRVVQHMVPAARGQSHLLSTADCCVVCQFVGLMFPSGLD